MNTDTPQPGTDLPDEEKARAIDAGEAWVDDYLDRHGLMIEGLQRALVQHALAQLLLALGPRYGRTAVARVLEALLHMPPQGDEADDIRRRIQECDVSLLHDGSADFDWEDLSSEIAHLFAFARYGYGRRLDPEQARAEIEGLLVHFRRVVADVGIRGAAGEDAAWLVDTLAAAEARWAIDHGRPVAPDGLAALAGVKPKTIANLLAARELPADAEGRIPAVEALRYLERRKGFVRSNWQYWTGRIPRRRRVRKPQPSGNKSSCRWTATATRSCRPWPVAAATAWPATRSARRATPSMSRTTGRRSTGLPACRTRAGGAPPPQARGAGALSAPRTGGGASRAPTSSRWWRL